MSNGSMDKQDLLRNLLLAAAVFFAVMAFAPYLLPSRPQQPPAVPEPTSPAAAAGENGAEGAISPDSAVTIAEAPEALEVELGSTEGADSKDPADSPFRMRVVLSNVGASVDSVYLTDHWEEPQRKTHYRLLEPVAHGEKVHRSFAVSKINIDGVDVALAGKRWQGGKVEPYRLGEGDKPEQVGEKASFHIDVNKDGAPAVRLTQTFYLPQQPRESGRQDMWKSVTATSLSENPHRIVVTLGGMAGIHEGSGYYAARNIDFAVQDASGYIRGERKSFADVGGAPDKQLTLFRRAAESSEQFFWLSLDNTYFAAIMTPLGPEQNPPAPFVAEVFATDLDGNPNTTDDVATSIVTTAHELRPGESVVFQNELYLGEKDRDAFHEVASYAARRFPYLLTAGVTWCTFSWLVELMIWLLNALYAVVRDFGIAIIILVIIVRACLHPITKKGQINMVRMQKKAGEVSVRIEEAKKKFGNDKARLQQEQMQIYREVGINPLGQILTCMPMALQMPIWVALFFSLSNNVLMRHQPFHFTWIHDLTAQDALIKFGSAIQIPIVGWELTSFNLLPILVAIFMYVQQKTQPRPEPTANMSEQQRQQQEMMYKIMPIMSIMMLLIFYKMPAGLNLYVMCSSLFGWLEQRHIRAHIKEREAAGTLHKPPPDKNNAKPKKLPGWVERLQKAAEEAQKAQKTQRRDKSGKRRR